MDTRVSRLIKLNKKCSELVFSYDDENEKTHYKTKAGLVGAAGLGAASYLRGREVNKLTPSLPGMEPGIGETLKTGASQLGRDTVGATKSAWSGLLAKIAKFRA